MKTLTTLRSAWQSWGIAWERQFDHWYRRTIGLPTLKRSEITPQLYLGGQYTNRGFAILRKRGITGIVSMRERATKNLPDLGAVHFLHLPTKDLHAPTLKQLTEGARFIQKELEQGGKVYVHCAAGEGRGPTMVAAYLISQGLTVEDALQQIRMVRRFIHPTTVQIERLHEFFAIQTQ